MPWASSLLGVVLGGVDREARQGALAAVTSPRRPRLRPSAASSARVQGVLAQLLRDAVTGWVQYGACGSFAPGVLQSPAGARRYRHRRSSPSRCSSCGTLVPALDPWAADGGGKGGTHRGRKAWLWAGFSQSVALPVAVLLGTGARLSRFPFLLPWRGPVTAPRMSGRQRSGGSSSTRCTRPAHGFTASRLLWGFHATAHYPVLIPVRSLQEHVYIAGGSGSGKTSRLILPLVLQLLGRREETATEPASCCGLEGGRCAVPCRARGSACGRKHLSVLHQPLRLRHARLQSPHGAPGRRHAPRARGRDASLRTEPRARRGLRQVPLLIGGPGGAPELLIGSRTCGRSPNCSKRSFEVARRCARRRNGGRRKPTSCS